MTKTGETYILDDAEYIALQERIAELERENKHTLVVLGETAKERDTWAGRASQYVSDEQTYGTHKELAQQLAAMELAMGVKDEALKVARTAAAYIKLQYPMDYIENYPALEAFDNALSTSPSELYRKVVDAVRAINELVKDGTAPVNTIDYLFGLLNADRKETK